MQSGSGRSFDAVGFAGELPQNLRGPGLSEEAAVDLLDAAPWRSTATLPSLVLPSGGGAGGGAFRTLQDRLQRVEHTLESLAGSHTQELAELHERLDSELVEREELRKQLRDSGESAADLRELVEQTQQRLTQCEDSMGIFGTKQCEMWTTVDSVSTRTAMHGQHLDRVTTCMQEYEELCGTLSRKVEDTESHSAEILTYMQELVTQEVKRVLEGTRGSIAELRNDVERIVSGQREAAGERAAREEVMREFVTTSCDRFLREASRGLATSIQAIRTELEAMQDESSRKLAANLQAVEARHSESEKLLEGSIAAGIAGCRQQIADLKESSEERAIADLDSRIEKYVQEARGDSAQVNTAQEGMREEFARYVAEMQSSNAEKMEELNRANDRAFDVLEQNFSDWMRMCETEWSVKESTLRELVQENQRPRW